MLGYRKEKNTGIAGASMESLIAFAKSFLAIQIVVYKLTLSFIVQGRPRFFLPLSLISNGVTGVHLRISQHK